MDVVWMYASGGGKGANGSSAATRSTAVASARATTKAKTSIARELVDENHPEDDPQTLYL